MGEVWLAEQLEPIRRRVALKLIKHGMDTRQVVARFDQPLFVALCRLPIRTAAHHAVPKTVIAEMLRTLRPFIFLLLSY
jgi:hypothetical protein